jgi:hypothetical protein
MPRKTGQIVLIPWNGNSRLAIGEMRAQGKFVRDNPRVRDRLPDAPWWVQSVVYVAISSGFWVVVASAGHWTPILVGRVIGGVVLGAVVGPVAARGRAHLWNEVAPMPIDGKAAVVRAAHRGPVPADESLRKAAWQFLRAERSRQQSFSWIAVCLLGVLAIGFLADTGSPASLIFVALVCLLGFLVSWNGRRWSRRERLLAGDPEPDCHFSATSI